MASHVDERTSALGPSGYVVPSGVAELRRVLAVPEVAASFSTWRDQGMTKKVADAILDMVTHPPAAPSSTEVQYGIGLGLTMAYQLLVDPSLLFPGVFGRPTLPPGGPVPGPDDPDYDEEYYK
ncbi:MAG: hypothetical protein HUJ63_06870 [Enterococcus sp.]|nr:hypothetical protein [Enterococcus sp.]